MSIKMALTGFYALNKISAISCDTDFSGNWAFYTANYDIKLAINWVQPYMLQT